MTREHEDIMAQLRLERYLDGDLSFEEAAEFERAVASDLELREQVELQCRIDAMLLDSFKEPPAASAVAASLRPNRWRWVACRVAAMFLIICSVAVAWLYLSDRPGAIPVARLQTMQAYYDDAVDGGFRPGWVCENDAEFADTFDYRFGQPMLANALPDGVTLLGLGYGRVLSRQTITVYATVGGEPVLVFVEPVAATAEPVALEPGLNRFQRVLGQVMLYEVSPLEEPQVLPHFSLVDRNGAVGH